MPNTMIGIYKEEIKKLKTKVEELEKENRNLIEEIHSLDQQIEP